MLSSIKDIDTLNLKTSDEAQNVSAATQEQSATMEEIAASSNSLARMAQEMRVAVAQFQV